MAPPADRDKPMTWVSGEDKDNAIVLTRKALYVATVTKKELPDVDVALEEGQSPDEVLTRNVWKVPLKRLVSLRYKHDSAVPNGNVTIFYDDDGRDRKKELLFGEAPLRDAFVTEIADRFGWTLTQEPESRAIIALKYAAAIVAIVLVTGFLTYGYLAGWIDRAPVLCAMAINWCGVWAILGAGGLFLLLALIAGIMSLVNPPVWMTYEPEDE